MNNSDEKKHLTILKPSEVEKITSLSRTEIWRLRKSGAFPLPIQLSPIRIGYRLNSIEEWVNSRPHLILSDEDDETSQK